MKLKHWGAFILLSLAWGSSFMWIKIGVEEIGPFTLVAFRLLFGALSMLLVTLIARPTFPRDRRTWIILIIVGLINTALPFTLITWGEQFIDSGVASLLNGSVPLWSLILAHFFLADERITVRRSLGLLVGFAGIVLLVSRDLDSNALQSGLLGNLAVLAAAFCYGGSSVFIKRTLKDVSPIVQTMITLLFADAFLWLAVPLVELPFQPPTLSITWIAVIWLGVVGSTLAYLLYFYLIQQIGATRTTTVTYAIPVVGVILGILFLNEQLDWRIGAATLLIIAGVYIVNAKFGSQSQMTPAEEGVSA